SWHAISGRVENLDAIAGANVEDLGHAETVPQCREAHSHLRFGDGKSSDLIDTRVSIGQTHHANLVHGPSRPRRVGGCVIERSRPQDKALSLATAGVTAGCYVRDSSTGCRPKIRPPTPRR